VQEFRVESNNYPAEFGTGTGGQVNVVTKSGSNLSAGRSSSTTATTRFDAPNYFDTSGGTAEVEARPAPVRRLVRRADLKDRAFFFGSYEGYSSTPASTSSRRAERAAWARAVPAIAPLRPGFMSPSAVILRARPPIRLRHRAAAGLQTSDENAFSARVDFR
jgi:hypothetical protein